METITKGLLKADRKRGMTLGQLTTLMGQAFRDELPPETIVSATVGFRGQVQSITLTPPTPEADA